VYLQSHRHILRIRPPREHEWMMAPFLPSAKRKVILRRGTPFSVRSSSRKSGSDPRSNYAPLCSKEPQPRQGLFNLRPVREPSGSRAILKSLLFCKRLIMSVFRAIRFLGSSNTSHPLVFPRKNLFWGSKKPLRKFKI
jgi:hypothetical protein